jgi:site-specific DNA recombinase
MPKAPTDKAARARHKLRCAIYTRKSSEEGLEQNFNSLDAQREACEAYITSQKHEGWMALPEMYDDGGFSGGTTERPALQRLLADVQAGRIDVIVVYKVDRLTRSLADFAKIVEIFDGKGVSFVSVTQQFNTTTSMGRLTLNVLLSFAQFEREVTGERIRDKIAASKRKGMWMGGHAPLGYDAKDRKLVVNQAEAETVRCIFERYAKLKSVRLLKQELDAMGVVSKGRRAADGTAYGAKPIVRGALYCMLQNRIYRGDIVHKREAHPGEHEAIVPEDLWDAVQATLSENRVDRALGTCSDQPSLLAGLLVDAEGQRMTPTHASKKGRRYRYYISKHLIAEGADRKGKGQRVPAATLEGLVTDRVRSFLADQTAILDAIRDKIPGGTDQREIIAEAARTAADWAAHSPKDLRKLLLTIVGRIQVHADRIEVALLAQGLVQALASAEVPTLTEVSEDDVIVLTIQARLRRTGISMRMVLEDGSRPPAIDMGLVRLVVRAHALWDRLRAHPSLSISSLAKEQQMGDSYATRLMRLAFLPPDIVSRILSGTQPPELTVRKMMDDTRLPLDWTAQRVKLGFV